MVATSGCSMLSVLTHGTYNSLSIGLVWEMSHSILTLKTTPEIDQYQSSYLFGLQSHNPKFSRNQLNQQLS